MNKFYIDVPYTRIIKGVETLEVEAESLDEAKHKILQNAAGIEQHIVLIEDSWEECDEDRSESSIHHDYFMMTESDY